MIINDQAGISLVLASTYSQVLRRGSRNMLSRGSCSLSSRYSLSAGPRLARHSFSGIPPVQIKSRPLKVGYLLFKIHGLPYLLILRFTTQAAGNEQETNMETGGSGGSTGNGRGSKNPVGTGTHIKSPNVQLDFLAFVHVPASLPQLPA